MRAAIAINRYNGQSSLQPICNRKCRLLFLGIKPFKAACTLILFRNRLSC
ncbi:two component system response regulator CheY family protein [Kingella kingae ATCC 23330]|uniref:Two component system response regulator CheY family protein n=1 Tax=Kingella kingae ATCC 23330 TaxID=887327 RepID=F5S6U7_KINKI|nr:two component system response regulator CheY family protein [Kingella kingae ATCC 23330]